jgi:hypothetical protein
MLGIFYILDFGMAWLAVMYMYVCPGAKLRQLVGRSLCRLRRTLWMNALFETEH